MADHTFEARLEVSGDGLGGRVTAVCWKAGQHPSLARPLPALLWERHRGGVAPGHTVVPRNGVQVDCRLENLGLVPNRLAAAWDHPAPGPGKQGQVGS